MAEQEELYEAVADYATSPLFTEAERLAVAFAERFAVDHLSLDQQFFDRLGEHFSAAEIVDIAISCASWVGLGRVNQVLDLHVSCPLRV